MDILILVAFLAFVAASWIALITGLVSASRFQPDAWTEAGRSKGGTIFGMIATGGIGALYYWAVVRREIADAAREVGARPQVRQPAVASTEVAQDPKAPAWHPDPAERHEFRWWDGSNFTDRVRDADVEATDALGADWS